MSIIQRNIHYQRKANTREHHKKMDLIIIRANTIKDPYKDLGIIKQILDTIKNKVKIAEIIKFKAKKVEIIIILLIKMRI